MSGYVSTWDADEDGIVDVVVAVVVVGLSTREFEDRP